MKVSSILLSALLAAILVLGPGDVTDQIPPPSIREGGSRNLSLMPPEPPSAHVEPGDRAPDFSFQGEDNRWRRLHDLLLQGPVVLVFGADPGALAMIEGERDAILRLGVVPVALMDVRTGFARATSRRLGLRYLVIPDSRRVIAAQFNAVDAGGQKTLPAWFVLDRGGRVRAVKRGAAPRPGFSSGIASALGLPDREAGVPAETRR